jgi:EmrB/QacA subfamily drug resistance transporter
MSLKQSSQDKVNPGIENNPEISKNQAYIAFAVVSLGLIMSSIDSSIVTVGLPVIINDLKTNLAFAGWTITGYQFSQSVMMPIIGKLSDDWGRKRLFLLAVMVFTISSLTAGLAPNIYYLIIFRLIQGIAGGAFLPSATGIISDAFGKNRSTFIGLFSSIYPIGSVIGPNIGGFIIDNYSWRWIFFVNIPIGILLLVLGIIFIPKSNIYSPMNRRIDSFGAGLFAGGVLAILYAMTAWANSPGPIGITSWLLFAIGLILLLAFFRYEGKTDQPMIEIKLLKSRPFLAANIYNFIFGGVVFGIFAFVPYYATIAYGMTAGQSGLVLTPRSIASIVVSVISSFFLIRFRYRLPMIIGMVIIALGLFLMSLGLKDVSILGWSLSNLLTLALIVMVGGIGMGIANPASNNAVLDMLPEKAAAITGLRGMFRMTGGIFGTTTVVLILSHFQDKGMGFERISLLFAIILLLTIPIVFLIPDSARDRYTLSAKNQP